MRGWQSLLSLGLLLWCLAGFYRRFDLGLVLRGLAVYASYFLALAAAGVTLFTLGRHAGLT
jgi:hypothetical protein